MTNRRFIKGRLEDSKRGNHGSLSFVSSKFYSYDDLIGRIEGKTVFVSNNPATITTENHIKMLSEEANKYGLNVRTVRL